MLDKRVSIYSVVEDGEEVFKGTAEEVADKLNIERKRVYSVAWSNRHGIEKKVDGIYAIFDAGQTMVKEINFRPVVKTEVKNDHFDIAVWALKTFGNTSVDFDPYPKLLPDMLELYGLDCSAEQKIEYPEKKRVSQRGRKKQPKVHWYVEVKYAIREGACI